MHCPGLVNPRLNRGWVPGGVGKIASGLPSGLVSAYTLGSSYGADLTGHGNVGAVHGPSVIIDRYGQALKFNGSSAYVLIADTPALRFSTSFSIVFWFQTGNTGQANRYVISRNDTSGLHQSSVIYGYVAQTIEFFAAAASGTDPRTGSQISVNDNIPHQIAYCYDGATWAGYKDGQQIFSTTRTFSLDSRALDGWYLGAANTSVAFIDASLSMLLFYNRGLLASEIARLYFDHSSLLIFPEDVASAQIGIPVFRVITGVGQRTIWWRPN